jgi:predicted alpha/beta-hydrolase family hydrolase
VEIMTGEGAARADVARPPGAGNRAPGPAFLLMLTHGSVGGPGSADLMAVRDAVLPLGAVVALVTQPYRVKGRRAPGSPGRQDAAWTEIVGAVREVAGPGLPLVQGGRSNGARVACRLHPPGHPEKSRAAELALAGTDVLVINGSRDPFGIPDQAARIRVVVLDGETHALSKKPETVGATAGAWLAGLPGLLHP